MNTLETTLIAMARQYLDGLKGYYRQKLLGNTALPDDNEYSEDHGALFAFVSMAHVPGSGMSPECVQAMLEIEQEHAAAAEGVPDCS